MRPRLRAASACAAVAFVPVIVQGAAGPASAEPEGPADFTITTVAGPEGADGASPFDLPARCVAADDGTVYVTDRAALRAVAPDGGVRTVLGGDRLDRPAGLALDAGGRVYVADQYHHVVRRVDPKTRKSTVVAGIEGRAGDSGDDGPATKARLDQPSGLAFDEAENLYIADAGNRAVRKVAPDGVITTHHEAPPHLGLLYDVAVDAGGALHYSTATRVMRLDEDGIAAPVADDLDFAQGIAFDAGGRLYVADASDQRVLRVNSGGAVAGNGYAGYSGDGGPAADAMLYQPHGVCTGANGRMYIADHYNHRIRMLVPIPDAPDLALTTVGGAAVSGDVIAEATGVDLTVTDHSGPANGTLTIGADGRFEYTADAGYSGRDTFTYTLTDALGVPDTGVVTVLVAPGGEDGGGGGDEAAGAKHAAGPEDDRWMRGIVIGSLAAAVAVAVALVVRTRRG